jgi:hypothetical protein
VHAAIGQGPASGQAIAIGPILQGPVSGQSMAAGPIIVFMPGPIPAGIIASPGPVGVQRGGAASTAASTGGIAGAGIGSPLSRSIDPSEHAGNAAHAAHVPNAQIATREALRALKAIARPGPSRR